MFVVKLVGYGVLAVLSCYGIAMSFVQVLAKECSI
jgi:hypothetical protein